MSYTRGTSQFFPCATVDVSTIAQYYLDTENTELRESSGIRSMICLNGARRGVAAPSLHPEALDNYDLKDGPGNDPEIFRRAVESVGYLTRRHPKLLVQCHAGRSRSVVVVAAYLMQVRGWSAEQGLAFVASKREIALTSGIELLLRAPFLNASRKP